MISVIIPAYNVGKYIEECIFSLVNQTYKDIEIIIVDDGSTDNTREIIRGFEIEYPYIKCYDQVNSGVSVARNFGLQKATGDYIIFVDPDDYLDEKMLEHMYEKMMENNSDIVICGHNIFYEENPNEYIKNIYNIDDTKTYNNIETINMMLELKVKGYVWDKLFRRINLINHNFKFEEGRYVQDWYPVFREVALAQRISFINKPLYFYRQRKTSTIYKKNKKLIDDYVKFQDNTKGIHLVSNKSFDFGTLKDTVESKERRTIVLNEIEEKNLKKIKITNQKSKN